MPFMVWNDRLSVNIAVIDNDHKKLLALTNELYDAIMANNGKQILERLLSELVDYTKFHFAREEEFLTYAGYADITRHKMEHDELTAQIHGIQKRFEDGSPALTLEVMNFLKDWLFNHILGSDAKYAAHLNAKGISWQAEVPPTRGFNLLLTK